MLGMAVLLVQGLLGGRAWLAEAAAPAGTSARRSACAHRPRMVLIPPGPFWMGSDRMERGLAYRLSSQAVREARWFERELPRRRVRLPAFCMERFLVRQSEYAVFVAATGHRPPGISRADYLRQGFLVHDDAEVTRCLWRDATPPAERLDHPVVLVSAADAEAYCRWRDPRLRLPREAEWEKAARGPGGTTPVARYPDGASPYGLFDAAGNVFQRTSTSLPDGRRVVKGWAWDDDPGLCRPAFRHGRPAEARHILIGFRCAGPA